MPSSTSSLTSSDDQMNTSTNTSKFSAKAQSAEPSLSPLLLFQPFNMIVFCSFYSPVILAILVTSMSILFQNFKGFIYLGYLIAVCIVRNYIYKMGGATPSMNDGTICTAVQYSPYGNPSFSSFVFSFTIIYLLYPMFVNGSINFWIVSSILVYFFIDIFIKLNKNCKITFGSLFLNILAGMTSAIVIVVLMYTGGSSKYLFFNETQSNKDVCSMPTNQTFKCNVYKNGELIGAV
jgi:hypothetical protein